MKKYVLIASLWMLLVSVKLMAQAPQYCASKSTFPWEQWIERVSMSGGNFSNPSGKEGYGNFTNFMGASLKRNVGNLITISPKSSWNGDPRNTNMYWRVWVDFNGDKDFDDAGEMLINRKVTISNGTFLDNEASFVVPATAKLGLTRLRVAMKVGGEPSPCEVFERGEVEDYTVDIIDEPTLKYCTAKGTTPWEQWIEHVWTATGTGSTNFPATIKNSYGNFTNAPAAPIQRGQACLIGIDPKSSWGGDPRNANMYWRAWIDLNNDNDFDDAGEMVISRQVVISYGTFLDNEQAFTVPANAKLGKIRLRIAMKVGGYPSPCETFDRGEVEDYTVNILESNAIQPLIVQGDLRIVPLEGSMRMDWVRKSNSITAFETEKSMDGEHFERISTMPATQEQYYVAYDNAPNEGDNFYRLKMNLNNGETVYSSIQKAKYEKLLDFTIFPNPSSDEAYIDLKKYEGKSVEIFMADINGKIVFNKIVENVHSAPLRLDLDAIENGFYGVVIKSKGKRDVLRFVQILK